MQETQVQSLGGEDPLEKEMATHSNILAWEIPWTEEPGGLQSIGWQKSQTQLSDKQQQSSLHNAAFVSAAQRCESAICIHTSPHLQPPCSPA